MTPEQIISAVWELTIPQTFRVALQTDLILFAKLWPVWVLLIVAALLITWSYE